MKRTTKLLTGVAAICLSAALTAGAAEAASIKSLFNGGPNSASDENREYLIDRDIALAGAPGNGVVGQLDVGDSLRFMFNINTLNAAASNVGGTTGNNGWTGVGQVVATTKVDLGGGIFSYSFAPDPLFAEGLGIPGAAIVFFEDATVDFAADFDDPAPAAVPAVLDDGTAARSVPPSSADVSTAFNATEEAFIATATDGTRFWTLGFTGAAAPIAALTGTGHALDGVAVASPTAAAGEGWTALTIGLGDNVLAAFGFANGTSGGSFNLGVTKLDDFDTAVDTTVETGDNIEILPVTAGSFGLVEFAGSGSLRGVNDLDTPFEMSSDLTFSFNAVPEPATLGILGAGLFGIGALASRYRRKRAAKA